MSATPPPPLAVQHAGNPNVRRRLSSRVCHSLYRCHKMTGWLATAPPPPLIHPEHKYSCGAYNAQCKESANTPVTVPTAGAAAAAGGLSLLQPPAAVQPPEAQRQTAASPDHCPHQRLLPRRPHSAPTARQPHAHVWKHAQQAFTGCHIVPRITSGRADCPQMAVGTA
jgi:hypothetical protein